MKPNYICSVFTTFFILFFPLICTACTPVQEPLSRTGFYFNTVITITLYDSTDESILDECFSLAQTYENRFSKTIASSDIWNINHAFGTPVEVHPDTIEVLQTSLTYAELSEGKIDPTIGTVSKLWDFSDTTHATLPEASVLKEALTHVDYHSVSIQNRTVTLTDPEAELDIGFIAKGYIADRIKEYLVSEGVSSAIINLGGNVLTIGVKPDGTPFQVGVQEPFSAPGTTALTLPVADCSIVSSGNYERYFTIDNKLYHHILDPNTGYPAETNLNAVTILSDSSMHGDALSTTCFLLGSVKGMQLIESLENTEAVFILTDGTLLYSDGLSP